jgi:hypothetical protein
LSVEYEPCPHLITDGDRARTGERTDDDRHRILRFTPRDEIEHVGMVLDARRFETGNDEHARSVAAHDECGEAFERHRVVPDEIRHVATDGKQQCIDTRRRHLGPRPIEAFPERRGGGAVRRHALRARLPDS